MKTNSGLKEVKSFLRELTIVTAGVLIALFLSNLKENNQARKYQIASIKTVNSEVTENYSNLKGIVEEQTRLIDTIEKYSADHITLSELILKKGGGVQIAQLRNAGLEFYTKNQINLIDFEMMSRLISMRATSKLLEIKVEKLLDFMNPNFFVDSKESKMLVIIYLHNIIDSENQLMHLYESFTDDYIKTKHKMP